MPSSILKRWRNRRLLNQIDRDHFGSHGQQAEAMGIEELTAAIGATEGQFLETGRRQAYEAALQRKIRSREAWAKKAARAPA